MNFDAITDAISLVFDTLKNDEESKEIIEKIDKAESDSEIKEGLRLAADRLDAVNPSVAKVVREKAKGFAF
jgi:hypothetical protein